MYDRYVSGRMIWIQGLILMFFVFFSGRATAQQTSKYEPPDGRIIHGLGQFTPFYYSEEENWQEVNEYQNAIHHIPMVYSVYAILDPYANSLDSTDFIDITTNHDYPYILLVGLALLDSSYLNGYQITVPVNNILSGALDYRIIDIAHRIKAIDAPVYLRPGFEFGSGNLGMHSDPDMTPADFINIWIHIYNIFSQQNVTNVAWVWNTVNPNYFNYLEWYPGDEYVDWWGINLYTLSQIENSTSFLNDAAMHSKPVMICESCPIHNNGTLNPDNWADWFIPYFNKIKSNTQIKAFVYISDPWDRGPFASWADSRIDNNELIRSNYETEIDDSIYIHMEEYLANPFIIGDHIPPDSVIHFTAEGGNQIVSLSWQNPGDPDLAGVRILRKTKSFPSNPNDGLKIYAGLDSSYNDTQVVNDSTYFYTAFAFDTIPNYSAPSLAFATPRNSTDIKIDKRIQSSKDFLLRNSPNPFNMGTIISWNSPIAAFMQLRIYNILGQKVFDSGRMWEGKGMNQIYWDTSKLSSGLYFGYLLVENKTLEVQQTMVNKMLLVK